VQSHMRGTTTLTLFSLVVLISPTVFAATPLGPSKDHRWYSVMAGSMPSAQAVRCRDCRADLVLRCVERGRGLMELTLLGASVSNGRAGATKQIRLTFGVDQMRRRALTQRQLHAYTPVIELGVDDPVLDRLAAGGVLRISFYGQRSFVGLHGAAAAAVGKVRAICRPAGRKVSGRHCIWAAVISCSSDRSGAEAVRKDIPHSFIRVTADGYCVTLAREALATAKAHVARYGGHVERSCVQ
jgi:hypothetical protein